MRTLTLPDATSVSYQYEQEHLTQVSYRGNTYRYLEWNQKGGTLLSLGIGEVGTLSYSWDTMGRLTSLQGKGWEESATYDLAGRMMKRVEEKEHSYTYDPLSQITSDGTHTYQYDSLYNLRKRDDTSFKVNQENQLTQIGSEYYEYDLNGNLISSSEATYTYDALGRLTSVTTPTFQEEYCYSYEGKRLTSTSSGKSTHFVYQGKHEIGTLEEGVLTQLRILGKGDTSFLPSTLMIQLDGTCYGTLSDMRGNIVLLYNQEGEVESTQRFSTFGSGAVHLPWGYMGKRHDRTGLIYFGKRFYHSDMQRWINPDPAGFGDGPNLYAYVHNAPTQQIDPFGLMSLMLEKMRAPKPRRAPRGEPKTAKDVVRFFSAPIRHTAHVMERVFHHILPQSFIKDALFISPSRALQGKSPKGYWKNRGVKQVQEGEVTKYNSIFILILGIQETESDARHMLQELQEMAMEITGEKMAVCVIYREEEGFVADVGLAVKEHFGHASSTREIAGMIQQSLEKLDFTNDPKCYVALHSRGALEFKRAANYLSKEQKGIMNVMSLGGACCIYKEEFRTARNMANPNDIVQNI